MRERDATRFRPQSSERGRDARRCQDAARHPFINFSIHRSSRSFASRSRSFGRSGEGTTPCTIGLSARSAAGLLREKYRVVAALLAGGDSRLSVDRQGMNKYLCPPLPSPAMACLSSCTASPISEVGFRWAAAAFEQIVLAPKALELGRIEACETAIVLAIRDYLGLDQCDHVMLTASGTDGMLLAACLVALEDRGSPMTAILPSPSETGTGVPLAASCCAYDGPDAGHSMIGVSVNTEHVALRGPDGMPREAGAVAEDFDGAIRSSRGRPVVIFTYGTKTGLVAPVEVPAGVDVIVDACQLRLPAHKVREYLKRGWPVVITGSKFPGGPAFSGAVLVPSSRFSESLCREACAVCARLGSSSGIGYSADTIGPLLRWSAALSTLEEAASPEDDVAESARRLEREAVATVGALLGARIIEQPEGCPGIVTFAVEAVGRPGSWLGADDLRVIYRGLADQGVLVGQPVDLGPFGGLRVAIGMRDVVRGSIETSLRRLTEAWPVSLGCGASRARAA